MLNKRVELWVASDSDDGFGGKTLVKTKDRDVWARVSEIEFENYDVVGASQNKNKVLVELRLKNIDTNINFFVIDGKEYHINDVKANFKKTQFKCICEAI